MKLHFIIILLSLAISLAGQSGEPVQLEPGLRVYPLKDHTMALVDSTGALTFDDIRQPAFQSKFNKLQDFSPAGPEDGAYWLKYAFTAVDSISDWLYVLKNPVYEDDDYTSVYLASNEQVDAYILTQDGTVRHDETGLFVPASQLQFPEHPRLNAIPFSLSMGDTAVLIVRVVRFNSSNFGLDAELRSAELGLPLEPVPFDNLFFLFIGVTSILGLLSFFFFAVARDSSYLFFGLYCFTLAVHYTILHSQILFIPWFIPEQPWLLEYNWIFLTHIAYVFYNLFGRAFVDLRRHSRLLDNFLLALTAGMIFTLVFDWFNLAMDWGIDLPVFLIIILVTLIVTIRIGFLPGQLTKFFAGGALLLLFFTALGLLYNTGQFTWFNPWPFGQMGMMIIYTLGLAYKLQLNERIKAEAERVLELDAVKSRFFANISHEFRTPLTLILGPLKKAQEQVPASDQDVFDSGNETVSLPARHLGMIRRNAQRLQQLINQLLDLSKLENGSMQLRIAEGDIVPFLRAMVFSFESLAERRQIHLQTEFPEPGTQVYFDRDKIEKIVVNLLSNAFKYTPEKGKVRVETSLENGRLKLVVADTGPGISKADLEKIFDRFYQVEGTEDKGTGIGLSLVRELVELHRGQISVESGKGKGTAFKVSLPVDKASFHTTEITAEPPEEIRRVEVVLPENKPNGLSASNGSADAGLPLLLIVEDNPDMRSFIAETMQQDFRVVTAENGRAGLEMAIEHTPDLIVSDVMMPEMDGFEMCETLKQDERTSHIPIVLLTAKAGQQHKVAGLETGADDYLTKPFDEKELMVRARNLVEQRRLLRERFGQGHLMRPSEVAVTSADERFLKKVAAAIEENLDNEFFSVEDLAGAVAFSRSQLHRKLKALTGKSPNEHIREFRLSRARELLEKRHGNVSEVAIAVGYSSLSYFTRSFKQAYGILPSEI